MRNLSLKEEFSSASGRRNSYTVARPENNQQLSREAAEERSPRRKPWVRSAEDENSPERGERYERAVPHRNARTRPMR
jgi:hypothetical protein